MLNRKQALSGETDWDTWAATLDSIPATTGEQKRRAAAVLCALGVEEEIFEMLDLDFIDPGEAKRILAVPVYDFLGRPA